MAFIKERVAQKDWELYNSFGLYNNITHEKIKADKYTNWVVDRDRDIYLVFTAVLGRENIKYYTLIKKGKKASFTVSSKAVRSRESMTNIQMHYEIDNVWIDKEMAGYEEELIEIIKEALLVGVQNKAVFDCINKINYRGEVK